MEYKVTGSLFGEIPSYFSWDGEKHWPQYQEIDEQSWIISNYEINEIRQEAGDSSIDELKAAEMWLAKNHPDYYMGGSVSRLHDNENLDISDEDISFLILPPPGVDYGEGNFETLRARYNWVKDMLNANGLEVVPSIHSFDEIQSVREINEYSQKLKELQDRVERNSESEVSCER